MKDQPQNPESPVAHHVSDILAKLQVRSRADAVRVAHKLGIRPQTMVPHP